MSLAQQREGRSFQSTVFLDSGDCHSYYDWKALMTSEYFDKIISVSMSCGDESYMERVPPRLETLNISLCKFKKLPDLPSTMRNIKATNSMIETFPRIGHCVDLETLNMFDCYLTEVSEIFPPQLRTLNLSFNKIKTVEWECFNEGLIDADVSFNKLSLPPPKELKGVRIACHHNDFDEMLAIRRNLPAFKDAKPASEQPELPTVLSTDTHVLGKETTDRSGVTDDKKQGEGDGVYGNSENVHFVSIQKSAADSLEIILRLCPRKKFNKNFISQIEASYRLGTWCGGYPDPRYEIPPIREWCQSKKSYTEHGVGYSVLLERVWTYIRSRWRRHQMIEVLKQELDASRGLCMTGLFTRTISILSGFVEGVHVGISEREQLQERVAHIAKFNAQKYRDDHDLYLRMTKLEVDDILNESSLNSSEKQDWLRAIE